MDASRKIDFCVIGAQKCGTTNLAEHLSNHPDVGFCKEKEPHFFSKSKDVKSNIDSYHELYDLKSGKKIYGEASTSYSFVDEYPDTAKRIFEYNPNMKIIFIVRDPVSRIESHYNHRLRKGYVHGGEPVEEISKLDDFVQRGQYTRQLQPYLDLFPSEQIMVLVFEEFLDDQMGEMKNVVEFLGLEKEKMPDLDLSPKNISDAKVKLKNVPLAISVIKWLEKREWSWRLAKWIPIKRKVPSDYKQHLYHKMHDDILNFEALIGRKIPCWHKWGGRKLEIGAIYSGCDEEANQK